MSSWHPTGRNRLQFIADEFWPGGGENGDGRDLYGVAEYYEAWREETTDADLIAEALHPSDADYFDRVGEDEFDRELDEMETEADATISVDGQPLDEYDDLPDGDDGPDTLELVLTRQIAIDPWCVIVPRHWNELDLVPNDYLEDGGVVPSGPGVATALARFERDGIRQIGSRKAFVIQSALDLDELRTKSRDLCGAPNSWKRHREAQYRPRVAA